MKSIDKLAAALVQGDRRLEVDDETVAIIGILAPAPGGLVPGNEHALNSQWSDRRADLHTVKNPGYHPGPRTESYR